MNSFAPDRPLTPVQWRIRTLEGALGARARENANLIRKIAYTKREIVEVAIALLQVTARIHFLEEGYVDPSDLPFAD